MIWAANASAGHTKKTTVIALYHIGYGLGNIISPQLFRPEWKVGYRFRSYRLSVLTNIEASVQTHVGYIACGKLRRRQALEHEIAYLSFQVAAILPSVIIIALRVYLSRENTRRDRLEEASHVANNGIIETLDAEGGKVTRVVDNTQLDLTDRENLRLWVVSTSICFK